MPFRETSSFHHSRGAPIQFQQSISQEEISESGGDKSFCQVTVRIDPWGVNVFLEKKKKGEGQ